MYSYQAVSLRALVDANPATERGFSFQAILVGLVSTAMGNGAISDPVRPTTKGGARRMRMPTWWDQPPGARGAVTSTLRSRGASAFHTRKPSQVASGNSTRPHAT